MSGPLQLNPLIPVRTVHGDGRAYFIHDDGPGSHWMWTVAVDATGEFYTVPNPGVRRQSSLTNGWDCSPFRRSDYALWPWLPVPEGVIEDMA